MSSDPQYPTHLARRDYDPRTQLASGFYVLWGPDADGNDPGPINMTVFAVSPDTPTYRIEMQWMEWEDT